MKRRNKIQRNMILTLPWPPTINNYYATVNKRRIVSEQGRRFRKQVADIVLVERKNKHVEYLIDLYVDLYPPDKRRRDIDNTLKPLLDAMTHAGVYLDDSQIRRMEVTFHDEILSKVNVELK